MHNNKRHELPLTFASHTSFILRQIALNIIEYTYNYNIIIMYSTNTLVMRIVIRMAHQSLDVEIINGIN